MCTQYVKSIYTTQKEDADGSEKNITKVLDESTVGLAFQPVVSDGDSVPISQIAPSLVSNRRGDPVTRVSYSVFPAGYRPERIPSSQPYIPSPVQRQPFATLPIVIGQSDEP